MYVPLYCGIKAPEFSQRFNRYGYVFNNPLRFIDPTGYTANDVYIITDRNAILQFWSWLMNQWDNSDGSNWSGGGPSFNNIWNYVTQNQLGAFGTLGFYQGDLGVWVNRPLGGSRMGVKKIDDLYYQLSGVGIHSVFNPLFSKNDTSQFIDDIKEYAKKLLEIADYVISIPLDEILPGLSFTLDIIGTGIDGYNVYLQHRDGGIKNINPVDLASFSAGCGFNCTRFKMGWIWRKTCFHDWKYCRFGWRIYRCWKVVVEFHLQAHG